VFDPKILPENVAQEEEGKKEFWTPA